MQRGVVAGTVTACLLWVQPGTARADDDESRAVVAAAPPRAAVEPRATKADERPPTRGSPSWGFTADALIGGGAGSLVDRKSAGTFVLGATWLLRYKALEVGPGFTFPWVQVPLQVTGLVGVLSDPARWFRLELLGEVGSECISADDGWVPSLIGGRITNDAAWLPYLGARGSVSFVVRHPAHAQGTLLIGAWLMAGSTTEHATVFPVEESGRPLSPHTVGGPSVAMGFRIGSTL